MKARVPEPKPDSKTGPASKPVSLRPLKFESAMDALLKVKPPKQVEGALPAQGDSDGRG